MSQSWLIAAVAALVLIPASSTWAQQPWRSERPYRGLFSGDTGAAPTLGQQFGVSGMLVSGYDDNLRAEARGGNQATAGIPGDQVAGSLSTGTAMATYSFASEELTFSAAGGGVLRYYPTLEDQFVRYAMASSTIAYSRDLWSTSTLTVAGLVSYRPYLFDSEQLFLGDGEGPINAVGDSDLPYIADSYLLHSERVALTQRLSRRTSLRGFAAYRGARSRGNSDTFGRRSYGGQLTHTLSQGLNVYAGYTRRDMRSASRSTNALHIIDIGASYNRALSFSRQTTLTFSTGTEALRRNAGDLRFRVTGQFQLTHEIGRTWRAWLSYHRSVLASEVWDEPVDADGMTTGVGGLVSRRLQVSAIVRGVLGRTGTAADAPGFDGVRASLNAGYAFNRFVNFTAMYAYYHHKFDDPTQLAIDLPPTLSRQSLRFGVTFWVPVFKSARRADASG
jgi:hypothetical protein